MSETIHGWQKVKLSEICEIISGGTPKTSISEYWNGDIYWLSVKDFNNDNRFVYDTEKKITKIGLENSSTNLLQYGDIIISARGTVGELAMIPYDMAFNQSCYGLRAKGNIDCFFLYYLVKDNLHVFRKNTHGSVFDTITKDTFGRINFILPPLPIQKKIAAVLSALDDKIELNNKINQNLEQQAQALFDTIYESKNNGILSDIVATVESGNRPKGGALAEGIPSIGAENIEKFGVYDYSKEKFIDAVFFEQMKRGKVKSEDVLLYKDGAYTGKVSLALDGFPHEVCAVNEHVFIIRAKQNVSSSFFLYFCLYNKNNRDYLYKLASSKAAQPGLNKEELLNLPIFIPDLQLIRNFSSNTAPMMHKIATNALENKKFAQLRDALLPKLMSGEVDVSKVNIDDFENKILGGKND